MKNQSKKSKTPVSSIIMYVFGIIVALIAIGTLTNNVRLFNSTIAQYVAQGYPAAEVYKQLIPGQLLPAIFEAVALYGGIAFILFSAGIINKKISSLLKISVLDEVVEIEASKEVESITETNAEVEAEAQTEAEAAPSKEN